MTQSLTQVALFLFIIILAQILKRIGLFTEKEGSTLSSISLNITLPAAIVASFNTFTMDYSLLVLVAYGIGANILLASLSYLFMCKQNNSLKAYALLSGSTYNVGNFSFPFIQSLFGAQALVAASLFDLGNALMTTGLTYSLASSVSQGKRPETTDIIRKLFTSVPFITYLVMITLSFAHIRLPLFLQDWMVAIGKANPIIAMLMIGIMLDIHFEKSWIKYTLGLLTIRYGMGILMAWYFIVHTDFNQIIKTTLVFVVFSPSATSSVAFLEKLTDEKKLASFTSSLSVLASIASFTILSLLVT
ncbi:permease [uncultured Sphaerochaeta sp.]|uniref:AEC family transporter n=1 Tax=uncultured Sphaerochaeta sp. TaxID=886478 RepID=UPI002AA7EF05|nr:permease [uncultured Sphaerochaeta sp.]MDC7229151.1 permease [Sphaerochaetaceae bacterium]